MSSIIEEKNKIIKSFFIIGLKDTLIQKYDDNENIKFVQNVDIFIKDLPYNFKPSNEEEKWKLLIKEKNVWLRIKYTYEYKTPITDFLLAECFYDSPEYILLEKKYIDEQYRPIMISTYKEDKDNKVNNQNELYSIMKEYESHKFFSEIYVKIPSYLNINEILNIKKISKCYVLLISRKNTLLPLKEILIQRKGEKFNFQINRNKSPYSFKYIPEILDQYPTDEERDSSVSMFCFPNGLEIKNIYQMPTWFTFVLTDELGERTYGSTLIFWEDIDNSLKENFIPYYDEIDIKQKKENIILFQRQYVFYQDFHFTIIIYYF